jgi:predicted  nucleic acid-binding Zn-ribbon protein
MINTAIVEDKPKTSCLEPLEFLSEVSFWSANRVKLSAWVEHVPFAFWLVEAASPGCFVELGTHSGTSYAAFCQAVKTLGLKTTCYAIDTWKGDDQTGFYGEDIFADLAAHNQEFYSGFSSLIRSTFDEALNYFEQRSIDLLHIDGYHTYDAVKHDFDQWYPKLSSRAVVLLHDINVREREFGVFRLWKELQCRWPSFEFIHGCGLGILGVGADLRGPLYRLFQTKEDSRVTVAIRSMYASLGSSVHLRMDKEQQLADFQSELSHKSEQILRLEHELASREQGVSDLEHKLASRNQRVSDLERELASRNQRVSDLERELASREERNSDLERELANSAQHVSNFERQLVRQRSEIEQLTEQVTHLQRALAESGGNISHLERRIESLKTSRSWQVTALLRWFDHLFSWKGGLWSNLKDEAVVFFWRIAVRYPVFHGARVLRYQTQRITEERVFDSQWYRNNYEGMPGVSGHPLMHYFVVGAGRGCDPNPVFNSKWYLEKYPEVAATGVNPLFHYIEFGVKFGFKCASHLDTDGYLARHPDVSAGGINALRHSLLEPPEKSVLGMPHETSLLADGKERQLEISKNITQSPSLFFSASYYISQLPNGCKVTGADAWRHYADQGWKEGRDPHPLFDVSWYLDQNPEIAKAGFEPLQHYLLHGWKEGRNPHPMFDVSWYLDQYPDVAQAGLEPLQHYLLWGWKEGRNPHPMFDVTWYLENHPELAQQNIEPLQHFCSTSLRIGRSRRI